MRLDSYWIAAILHSHILQVAWVPNPFRKGEDPPVGRIWIACSCNLEREMSNFEYMAHLEEVLRKEYSWIR